MAGRIGVVDLDRDAPAWWRPRTAASALALASIWALVAASLRHSQAPQPRVTSRIAANAAARTMKLRRAAPGFCDTSILRRRPPL